MVAIGTVIAGLEDEHVRIDAAEALGSLGREVGVEAGGTGMQALRVCQGEKEEKE